MRKRRLPRTSPHSSCCRARRRQRQCHVHGWFCCCISSLAVSPSFVGRPELQARAARHHGWYGRDGQFYVLVLLVLMHRCSASLPVWTRRTVAWRDYGRHGAHGPDCIKRRKFCTCSSLRSSTFPSRRRGRFPRSCRTTEFPQWRVHMVVDVPVCRSCRFFVAVCVKTVEILLCSSSYSCLDKVVVIPVVAQMQIPLVRFPQ